jgi:predicted Zn-dependent protease with MMP-like domain
MLRSIEASPKYYTGDLMGGYYPALAVRPPEPLGDQLTRAVQLRSLIGQQQMQQIQIQDMQAQTRAMQQWDGKDWNDYADLVRKNGGSGQTVMGINQHLLQQRAEHSIQIKNDAEAFKAKTEATQKIMDNAAAEIDNLKTLKPEDQAQGFEKAKQNIIGKFPEAADIVRGMQYNGPDSIDLYEKSLLGMSNYNKQLTEQAQAEKDRQQAARDKVAADAARQKAPFELRKETAEATIKEQEATVTPQQRALGGNLAYQAAIGTPGAQRALQLETQQKREAAIAQVQAQAQMYAGNAALAKVPPHLVGAATGDATKAATEYAGAKSVSDRLAAIMDEARKGNVLSYQVIPEEGTLQLITAQGVHRINSTEISQYAGAGSLWQRMQGRFGKALSGQSLPASVLTDMQQIQNIVASGSKSKYENTLKSINQNYGSNFQPVDMSGLEKPSAEKAFSVPQGAPPAPKEDGHKLKQNGSVIAISKGGQWVAP